MLVDIIDIRLVYVVYAGLLLAAAAAGLTTHIPVPPRGMCFVDREAPQSASDRPP